MAQLDLKLRTVERAAAKAVAARAELERLIREAHDQGHSLRDIAASAGMSHEKVRAIVKKRAAARSDVYLDPQLLGGWGMRATKPDSESAG